MSRTAAGGADQPAAAAAGQRGKASVHHGATLVVGCLNTDELLLHERLDLSSFRSALQIWQACTFDRTPTLE